MHKKLFVIFIIAYIYFFLLNIIVYSLIFINYRRNCQMEIFKKISLNNDMRASK
jgi:hypothetical protein